MEPWKRHLPLSIPPSSLEWVPGSFLLNLSWPLNNTMRLFPQRACGLPRSTELAFGLQLLFSLWVVQLQTYYRFPVIKGSDSELRKNLAFQAVGAVHFFPTANLT